MYSRGSFIAVVSTLIFAGLPSAALALPPAPPGVEVTTTYGIEFSTVGCCVYLSRAMAP